MNSEGDTLKTNEFLRLRKLRLQQVREQSKDIAKKIRQRAKVEQLRHVSNVDSNKEKAYLQRQEKLVNRLEQLYSRGIENVGAGHKNANEVNKKDIPLKKDLSKLRGKEAVAELRKKKQQKLDEQKKVLDRKLQARETANELSREKSVVVVNTLAKSSSSKSVNGGTDKPSNVNEQLTKEANVNIDEGCQDKPEAVTKNDMGTQWNFEEIPNEWEPYIPALSLPKDDSAKKLSAHHIEKTDKSKRLNLFALSDEMPSSLRGGVTSITDEQVPIKPSLTLVSEYLQNRGLRLREPDITSQKKSLDDLQNIKQTLLKTRASRTNVSGRSNKNDHSSKITDGNDGLSKKHSVTMYDHNTRDIRDMPHNSENFVIRDQNNDEDAYFQALREASIPEHSCTQSNQKTVEETRNRIAIAKQNVDKEYRDTLAFLNSLPKERTTKSMRTAYMDGDRQQEMKDKHQQRLQQEYKRACSKRHCKHTRCRTAPHDQNRSKSKSSLRVGTENNVISRDFQYAWLPVPESDGSLAIHTVSNNAKDKPGNTVKFSSVDTYHEYRSRHKHTPPTKDVTNEQHKRVLEAVIIQENDDDYMEFSSESDSNSVNNFQEEIDLPSHKADKNNQLDNAEKIIIYKVIDSSKNNNHKAKMKSAINNKVSKAHNDNLFENNTNSRDIKSQDSEKDDIGDVNKISFTQLKEGVYKSVRANGDNIASMPFPDDQQDYECTQNKHDKGANSMNVNGNECLNRSTKSCDTCKSKNSCTHQRLEKHPSAATSTSSFKTALNDKANHPIPDGGFIKFVDEGGQDAGKFYVGASGFLKDEAYEVVIQLRKKEAEKYVQSQNFVKHTTKTHKTIQSDELCQEQKEKDLPNIFKENMPQSNPTSDKNTSPVPIQINNVQQLAQDDDKSTQFKPHDQSKQDVLETPKIQDKAVCTSFRDSFAIPENMPKLDPVLKQATSTYTQTTNNSPITRPMLMHLSSSTSTTYMSPPELVLPRYFKKGSDGTYENSSNLERQHSQQKESKLCWHGKCNKQHKHSKVNTPPNTTRSTDQTDENVKLKYNKKYPKTEHKHRISLHKCRSRSEPKICRKQRVKRSSSDHKRIYASSNYSTMSSQKSRLVKNGSKINLNPVIENYVKKLLALNKEGLKAIEVINQECSEVTTPGSSIIEVPHNIDKKKTLTNYKISLEQIKNSLKEQILKSIDERKISPKSTVKTTGSQTDGNLTAMRQNSNRRRPLLHKVKSLNISKQLLTTKGNWRNSAQRRTITTSPMSDYSRNYKSSKVNSSNEVSNTGIKSSLPTPRKTKITQESSNNTFYSDSTNNFNNSFHHHKDKTRTSENNTKTNTCTKSSQKRTFPSHKAITTIHSSDSEVSNTMFNRRKLSTPPISISTQTNHADSDVEFMKLAENKLQNMEKIADLTEKCTKRLSNLAKVLEEVRKHKSLAYSQISSSDSTSDSDQQSGKIVQENNRVHNFNPTVEIKTLAEALSSLPTSPNEQKKDEVSRNVNTSSYVPVLLDIPKPDSLKSPSPISFTSNKASAAVDIQQPLVKNRGRPPPALTRINLKNVPDDFVIPHELSTVVEVDSPMSMKIKNHTSGLDSKNNVSPSESYQGNTLVNDDGACSVLMTKNTYVDNNFGNKLEISKEKNKAHSIDSSDDSKLEMMDLKQFNEIMLKPFISLHDYAKQYNLDEPDTGSIHNVISKDEHNNEVHTSVQSDTSIPDIVAELLKRNLISEPFKFETTSATLSSESTLSMLALSRTRKDKKKSGLLIKNKENMAETSESLSISSNPDLEHAFQRLGMGWASSTLKKTKERLALSSSSNTSSSSMSQLKKKSFNFQDIPDMSKNSLMSLNISNNDIVRPQQSDISSEMAKNALQQTSLTNSMTVKEFLANELAKKITFSNKSNKNATEDEFITLCETKMPDELKQLSYMEVENKKSIENTPNIRARTSTPVQLFKSMTYHSTSSSNTSNGLFSNADDLSSVKVTSNSNKNHSTSDKDDLTIPNYSLKLRKGLEDCSKSD